MQYWLPLREKIQTPITTALFVFIRYNNKNLFLLYAYCSGCLTAF